MRKVVKKSSECIKRSKLSTRFRSRSGRRGYPILHPAAVVLIIYSMKYIEGE